MYKYNDRFIFVALAQTEEDKGPIVFVKVNPENVKIALKGLLKVKVNNLNIRYLPGTSSDIVGKCNQGDEFNFDGVVLNDNYIWFNVGDNMWLADNNNEYVDMYLTSE